MFEPRSFHHFSEQKMPKRQTKDFYFQRARRIKAAYNDGRTMRSIADEFGVTETRIWQIIHQSPWMKIRPRGGLQTKLPLTTQASN